MTCRVVLQLIEILNLDWQKTIVQVLTSSTTEQIGGTSADLIPNERISIQDLMFGMMLPSGNDAA